MALEKFDPDPIALGSIMVGVAGLVVALYEIKDSTGHSDVQDVVLRIDRIAHEYRQLARFWKQTVDSADLARVDGAQTSSGIGSMQLNFEDRHLESYSRGFEVAMASAGRINREICELQLAGYVMPTATRTTSEPKLGDFLRHCNRFLDTGRNPKKQLRRVDRVLLALDELLAILRMAHDKDNRSPLL